MITLTREEAQQVLDDLCGAKLCEMNSMSSRAEMLRLMDKAIETLRARLSATEPEPVAWYDPNDFTRTTQTKTQKEWSPLYTAPPQREWQSLTSAQMKALWVAAEKKPSVFAGMIESKLKELNHDTI